MDQIVAILEGGRDEAAFIAMLQECVAHKSPLYTDVNPEERKTYRLLRPVALDDGSFHTALDLMNRNLHFANIYAYGGSVFKHQGLDKHICNCNTVNIFGEEE